MAFNNPFALTRVLDTIHLAELVMGDRVVDVGCGSGELLQALHARGLRGHGFDLDAAAIGLAAQAPLDGLTFEVTDALEASLPDADLLCCLGSTHAYGPGEQALTGALSAFRAALRPGAKALIGEGFHRRPLPAPYAELLGSPTGIERTHAQNVATCEGAGFAVLHAITAGQDEWDAFEWSHHRRALARAKRLPPEQAAQRTAAIRAWRDGYLRWGREVMGFGLYLLEAV